MGQRPSPGGRCNDPAPGAPGFVLDVAMRNGARCMVVDHQGPGRASSLTAYAAALQAAGFEATVEPRSPFVAKRVVFLASSLAVTP